MNKVWCVALGLLLATCLLWSGASAVDACECLSPSVSIAYRVNDEVIQGRVLRRRMHRRYIEYFVSVGAVYKGPAHPGSVVRVHTTRVDEDCGVLALSVGQHMLIYGRTLRRGVMFADICSPHKLTSQLFDFEKQFLNRRLLPVCQVDEDCAEGYCAPDKVCEPWRARGQSCGERPFPGVELRCLSGLSCVEEPPEDGEGATSCQRVCPGGEEDCLEGQFCSSPQICREDGACVVDQDCAVTSGNVYPREDCAGQGLCEEGACRWECFGDSCREDQHCSLEQFCLVEEGTGRGECVARGGEGSRCSGSGELVDFGRCQEGLGCVRREFGSLDTPGQCRRSCVRDEDCLEGQFCSDESGVCLEHGACVESADCQERSNVYPRDVCPGQSYDVCTGGQCIQNCYEGRCPDFVDVARDSCPGRDEGSLIVNGACQWVDDLCESTELWRATGEQYCDHYCLQMGCQDHEDCPGDQWCRFRTISDGIYSLLVRECAPYQEPGGECGYNFYGDDWMQVCPRDQVCTDENWSNFDDARFGSCVLSRNALPEGSCGPGQYFLPRDGTCRDVGTCHSDYDCDAEGNDDIADSTSCEGESFVACNNGRCARRCGSALCRRPAVDELRAYGCEGDVIEGLAPVFGYFFQGEEMCRNVSVCAERGIELIHVDAAFSCFEDCIRPRR